MGWIEEKDEKGARRVGSEIQTETMNDKPDSKAGGLVQEGAAISLTSAADSPLSPCPAGLAMACRPRRGASSRHNRQTRMQKQKGHSAAQRAALENAIESGSGKIDFESFG